MFRCAPLGLVGVVSIVVCVGPEVVHGECIDRIVVRPVGRITNADQVRLEVEVHTSMYPAANTQPTEVSIVADSVVVRMYVAGGLSGMPDSMTEVIELGVLDPQTYHYAIDLNPTTDPPAATADGTFCVEDADCADSACRCPVFTPQYSIVSIGAPESHSWGQAINDLGQVAGRAYGSSGQHAFLWTDGTMTDLGTLWPNDLESSGLGINNHGDVVGYSGPGYAVLWHDGQIIQLGTLGYDSIAYAINDARQIVGSSVPYGYVDHAVLWQNGELIDLTTTFGAPMSRAVDINASGQIVVGNIILQPDGTITELPTLGGAYAGGLALNDRGHVVGKSQRGDGSYYDWHAFLWDGEVMSDLGAFGLYKSSEAVDINNSGQVIGLGDEPDPWCSDSFLYEPGKGLRKLRGLIPVDSGWTSFPIYPGLWAYGINDRGQITGLGYFNGEHRTFLMTPIPSVQEDPIPTISQWGAAILTLLVLCAGSGVLLTRARCAGVGIFPVNCDR
jgi:probable HAF family extracellular repeat protein